MVCACHIPSTFFLPPIMSSQPIDWTKVPRTELVSDLEVMVKVAEAKAGKKQWREVEVEVEVEAEVEAEH